MGISARRRASLSRRRLLFVALVVIAGTSTIMFTLANARPILRTLTVELSGLPPGSPPLRVALMSDLHVARLGDTPDRLRETVSRVVKLRPDVVLIAGDFMADRLLGGYGISATVEPLAQLHARYGVLAVLGNHDYGKNRSALVAALARRNIPILENDARQVGPLRIIGIGDSFSHHAGSRMAFAVAEKLRGVPIVFTHSPEPIAHLPTGIELAMAGHTHCGQIVLPFVGAFAVRSRYGPRYSCGIVREGRRTSIITAGLGVSRVPLRLSAPPDFWMITLKPQETPPAQTTPSLK